MSAVSEILRAAGACTESITWAEAYEDADLAWYACTDVEWMLWWIDRCGDTPQRHLLIADLAEAVLTIYERHFPGDTRVRDCIQARRAYARGEINEDQWAAPWEAAWDAAMAAAKDASRGAAWDAACAAALAASRGEAGVEAEVAASDAARAAAMDAAGIAARDAAGIAVWDAAGIAVWDAARKRQRLITLYHYPTPPTLEAT